ILQQLNTTGTPKLASTRITFCRCTGTVVLLLNSRLEATSRGSIVSLNRYNSQRHELSIYSTITRSKRTCLHRVQAPRATLTHFIVSQVSLLPRLWLNYAEDG